MIVKLNDKVPKTPFPPSAIGTGCLFIVKGEIPPPPNAGPCLCSMVYECTNVIPGSDQLVEVDVEGRPLFAGGESVSAHSGEIIVVDISSVEVTQKAIEYQGVSVDDIHSATEILRKQEGGADNISGVIDLLIKIADEAKGAAE